MRVGHFFASRNIATYAYSIRATRQIFINQASIDIAAKVSQRGFNSSIVELLNAARQTAARNVNALMTASYWEIGRRIVEAEQKGRRRAGYGEQLIERLSLDLTQRFGRGFSADNLEHMRTFYVRYPPSAISETLSRNSDVNGSLAISQTPSRKLSLTDLAQAFVLPWSA
jgi:hypothetical protein